MSAVTTPSSTAAGRASGAAPALLHLERGPLRLSVAPEVGGSIAAFSSRGADGRERHWLRPASVAALAARDPLGMSSFPLAPYCNRIRDGRSDYGVLSLALAPNMAGSPHAIHGTAWRRPWQVEQQLADTVQLRYQHRPEGPHDWPYPFSACQHLQLDEHGLRVEIALTNDSEHPMPSGLGHHPYFPHRRGTRLTTRVDAMWASDAELLPTELTRPPFLKQLAEGIDLDELVLDNNFIGWSREARVDWPDTGDALLMRAQPPLDFFVLYSPRGADHFCMEPVSNCTDWMNLAAHGVFDAGGTLLAPGAMLSGYFELRPLPAGGA